MGHSEPFLHHCLTFGVPLSRDALLKLSDAPSFLTVELLGLFEILDEFLVKTVDLAISCNSYVKGQSKSPFSKLLALLIICIHLNLYVFDCRCLIDGHLVNLVDWFKVDHLLELVNRHFGLFTKIINGLVLVHH